MAYRRPPPIVPIRFFEFRRLIKSGELEGVIIADTSFNNVVVEILKILKLYDIPNVYFTNTNNRFDMLYNLDNEKCVIKYLESNLIDRCNLNCKGCTHFANLFNENEFYALEDFQRDIKQIAKNADVLRMRLMGGEPLLLKNLPQYLKIARRFLPHTDLRLVTNGLLIANTPKYIFDSLRENKIVVDVSLYPPTLKHLDEITEILKKNGVLYAPATGKVKSFNTVLTLQGAHNPVKSRQVCWNDECRFLRNGKIYKCPVDALSFKFAEHFGLNGFPEATGVDIFAKNFNVLMEQLDGNIELCTWCNETVRQIDWTPENNPKITDWLANPEEIKNFLPK